MGFLLESNEDDTRLARYSFMGIAPAKTIAFKHGEATVTHHRTGQVETFPFENPLHLLQSQLGNIQKKSSEFPFTGGLVGYTGYGATRYFEHIPQQSTDPFDVPEGCYGLYDSVIVFDHLYRRIHFLSHQPPEDARHLWQTMQAKLKTSPALMPLSAENIENAVFEKTHGPFTQTSYCEGVEQCKALIRQGELFQIVLSQRFSMPVTTNPIHIYRVIRAINPSPYSYFLKFPEFFYLGASPETFARCENGQMMVKVLAGTRPRGQTEAEDEALMQSLITDEKELAEHRMLVDLGRNDLGRVCEPGSIELGDIATVTRYTHVMHLATRVSGKLKADKTAFDAFQSVFPRGTVSGAPKIRAMQHLAKLEPEQRGIYAGAVGYFDFNGNMDSAIAIRSVLVKEGQAHVNAGAGIVYDSDPISEYQETRNKAKSILKAVQLAEGETRP